jgi:AcrR family transcriptional regulator
MLNPDSPSETAPRPLRERLREETANAIAAAAEQVFARSGIRDARMEDIAQQAGVAVGTVYNHFQDRDTLLQALVERRRAELVAKLDQLNIDAKHPFENQLFTFVRVVFDHFESHRAFLAIQIEADSKSWANPSPAMREIKARALTLVQRGIQQKVLRPSQKELFPSLLFGAIRSLLVYELQHPGKASVAERAETVTDFFLHGAGPK